MKQYVASLRGVNVGGHHKLSMPDLRSEMERLNFRNVITVLNSGNVCYIFKKKAEVELPLPGISSDNSCQILLEQDDVIFSALDLSAEKTIEAMDVLGKFYGKDITARNWNTFIRREVNFFKKAI